MKPLHFAFIAAFMSFPCLTQGAELKEFQIVTIVPNEIIVRSHELTRDKAQISVAGDFSSSCYKLHGSHVHVDTANNEILIHTEAAYFPSSWCLFVMVPFQQEINLGPMESGDYSVLIQNEEGRPQESGVRIHIPADR